MALLDDLRRIMEEVIEAALVKVKPDPPAEPVVRKRKVGRVISLSDDAPVTERPFLTVARGVWDRESQTVYWSGWSGNGRPPWFR
jgi:hypothetical protein